MVQRKFVDHIIDNVLIFVFSLKCFMYYPFVTSIKLLHLPKLVVCNFFLFIPGNIVRTIPSWLGDSGAVCRTHELLVYELNNAAVYNERLQERIGGWNFFLRNLNIVFCIFMMFLVTGE